MEGTMVVSYKILCENDLNKEIRLEDLLANEKIARLIRSEFAKGYRNIELSAPANEKLTIATKKEIHSFEVSKNDFADLLTLAEEDAHNKKLFKKECARIELVDIETL